jgi:metallo-beta-lactamase family protein
MTIQPAAESPPFAVTFWGAARSVTGSMHLVQAGGKKILLDCGLERAHHHLPHQHPFPFAPSALDAVVLSHAHVDHCGHLPHLVSQGFAGPIYCTPATRDLVSLMLHSSARFHEEEALVRDALGVAEPDLAAGFRRQVDQVIRQCAAIPYENPFTLGPDLVCRLVNAGHILGSAMVHLTARCGSKPVRLTFTGDLGRRGAPLLADPAAIPAAEMILCECTYGGRILEPIAGAIARLEEVVRSTVERGGKTLIPAFSLGRTQVLTRVLVQGLRAGKIPPVPLYIDGPLAADIAQTYRHHPEALDEETAREVQSAQGCLDGPEVRYVRSQEESRALSQSRAPAVILAPGGMCEGGRILQHLKHQIDDPRSSIVLVSYQAPHTPGRRLLERGPTVRFHGRKWNKWADVHYLAGFSGHADHNDLVAYLCALAGVKAKVCFVHGELEQAQKLRSDLLEHGITEIEVPERGQTLAVGG